MPILSVNIPTPSPATKSINPTDLLGGVPGTDPQYWTYPYAIYDFRYNYRNTLDYYEGYVVVTPNYEPISAAFGETEHWNDTRDQYEPLLPRKHAYTLTQKL